MAPCGGAATPHARERTPAPTQVKTRGKRECYDKYKALKAAKAAKAKEPAAGDGSTFEERLAALGLTE